MFVKLYIWIIKITYEEEGYALFSNKILGLWLKSVIDQYSNSKNIISYRNYKIKDNTTNQI